MRTFVKMFYDKCHCWNENVLIYTNKKIKKSKMFVTEAFLHASAYGEQLLRDDTQWNYPTERENLTKLT